MKISPLIKLFAMIFCISIVSACASNQATEPTATISGQVIYLQRIAVPPQAEVTVTLADVSLQDVAATTLAQDTFTADGKQVPFPFTLTYRTSDVKAGHTYALRASIHVDGRLWFTTTEHIAVKLDGTDAQPVEVRVNMVR